MSLPLDFLIAQSFSLTSALTGTATDQGGAGRTITYWAGGSTGYFRTFLASTTGGTGTLANPREWLTWVKAVLNLSGTYWDVTLNSECKVVFTYLGTGTGTINLPATVQYLLGFTTSTVGPLATLATQTGGDLPSHCVFSVNFGDDSGWVRKAPRTIVKEMPTGETYGHSDRLARWLRRVRLEFHPKNSTVKTAQNAAHPTDKWLATVMYPPDSRFGNSYTSEPAQALPWSVSDTLNIQVDQRLGVAFGNLQALIAGSGSDLTFDVCCLTEESLKSGCRQAQSRPLFDSLYDVLDVEFTLVADGKGKFRT